MSLRVVCVALLAVLLCVDASPVQETENARVTVARTLRSVLNPLGLEPDSRVRREIETRQAPSSINCSDARDCWPDGVTGVPSTLINCDSVIKECICNDCFFRNSDTGRCEEDSSEDYFFRDGECVDDRQAPSPMNCTIAQQCWPDNVTGVPSTLINCDSVIKECICNDCFFRNSDTGRCEEDSCEDYFFRDGECVDDRPSQLTAFLLSLFLSSTGAANFYIGQNGLGAGQLVILLVLIMCSCSTCCIRCCVEFHTGKDEKQSSNIFYLLFKFLILVVVLCLSIAIWAWWLADLIIFATDQRDAGNGCDLSPDL